MSLTIQYIGGVYRPTIFCDHCGQEITEAADGNYHYEVDDNGLPVDGRLFFTHKDCCRPFEQVNNRFKWDAVELACLPLYLGRTLKVDGKTAKTMAEYPRGGV